MNHKSSDSKLQRDLEYLYALTARGIKPGLQRIKLLLQKLGAPHKNIKYIHIAGTNGKGTTCAIIASVLQEAGYRVGLYTSPHLLNFNERVRVNRRKIPDSYIADFINTYRSLIDEIGATFFEATTAMALSYFSEKNVDYAVLETGLGGRFDATNIVSPEVTVITSIGKDHEERLGKTLTKIAFEKAGIGKSAIPCILSRQRPLVRRFLVENLTGRDIPVFYAPEMIRVIRKKLDIDGQHVDIKSKGWYLRDIFFPFIGDHQLINLQTAVSALCFIKLNSGFESALINGLKKTLFPGRLQVLRKSPLVLYDVGHNLHGFRSVIQSINRQFVDKKIKIVIALGGKKSYKDLGRLFSRLNAEIYISEIPGYNSVPAENLRGQIVEYIKCENVKVAKELIGLIKKLLDNSTENDVIVLIGSHYLAPTIYPFFRFST